MNNASITVEVDTAVDTAYITLSDEDVVRTRRVTDDVNVDLDNMNVVVGVEMLRRAAPLPLDELATKFHVQSDTLELLQSVAGAIAGHIRFGYAGDGEAHDTQPRTSSAVPQPA